MSKRAPLFSRKIVYHRIARYVPHYYTDTHVRNPVGRECSSSVFIEVILRSILSFFDIYKVQCGGRFIRSTLKFNAHPAARNCHLYPSRRFSSSRDDVCSVFFVIFIRQKWSVYAWFVGNVLNESTKQTCRRGIISIRIFLILNCNKSLHCRADILHKSCRASWGYLVRISALLTMHMSPRESIILLVILHRVLKSNTFLVFSFTGIAALIIITAN